MEMKVIAVEEMVEGGFNCNGGEGKKEEEVARW